MPLGKARIFEQGDQIVADVQFNPTPDGQAWYLAIKWDFENPPPIQQYSWGYDATRSRPGEFKGQRVRFLDALKIHEVSPVVVGASIGTATASVKQFGLSPGELEVLHAAQRVVDAYEREQDGLRAQVHRIAEGLKTTLRVATWCKDLGDAWDTRLTPINESLVPALSRRIGDTAINHFAQRLGTDIPSVQWFIEPGRMAVHGACNVATGTVMLNAHQGLLDLWLTAGHEVGHLRGWDERQCRAFEQVIEKELRQ
jgi:hypothetical protein